MLQKIKDIIEEFKTVKSLPLEISDIGSYIAYKTDASSLREFLQFLKTDKNLRFTILSDLFAADFPSRNDRFEITYNLLSLELNQRMIVKIHASEDTAVHSICDIFSAANWYEREIFDMFGINFQDHPDMRRILTDYGFVGHPLKKDFPLTGYMQVKYDEQLEQVVYEPVNLDQEYRYFDFSSPWAGPTVLPGDEKATKGSKE
jgi:NADH-quinone oxidoreductase subunit C